MCPGVLINGGVCLKKNPMILKILADRPHNNPSALFTWDIWHQEGTMLDDEDEEVQTRRRSAGFAGTA